METVNFQIRKEEQYDVAVCGGGCAGVIAAIAAARQGAKTVLIERNSEIGGTATASLVGPFMTCFSPDGKRQLVGGIFDELIRRMEKKGGAIHPSKTGPSSAYGCYLQAYDRHNNVTPFHPGYMTLTMAELLQEAGVTVHLNSVVVDAVRDEIKSRVTGVIVYDGKEFRKITADVFVDATGDAILSEKAGVTCLQGTEQDRNEVQPMSLFFWIYNVDDEKLEAYLNRKPEDKCRPFHEMIEKDRADGNFNIPRNKIGLYHMVNDGEWRLNTTRLQGYDPSDPDSVTTAYFEGLKQVAFLLDYFKKCPGLENAKLGHIGSMIGIRESKRIEGLYTLTADDLIHAKDFEDTIALSSYMIDMHPAKGTMGGGCDSAECAPVYAIPYRIMVPRGLGGLLVAGRCVSATRDALAAVRVMPPVMAMGEAAGVAAALCAKQKIDPENLNTDQLRKILRENGAQVDL